MGEVAKSAEEIAEGILVEGSPFREILVRATQMKMAGEQLIGEAVHSEEGSSYVVSGPVFESLREAVGRWSEPLE